MLKNVPPYSVCFTFEQPWYMLILLSTKQLLKDVAHESLRYR